MRRWLTSVASVAMALLALTACQAGAGGQSSSGGNQTITVAAVDNPQMEDLRALTPQLFEKDHPNIKVNFVLLPENQVRQQTTQDFATHGGRFDVATIGTYEVPLWAKNGWIQNLQGSMQKDSSYDTKDIVSGIGKALTYKGSYYAAPFYGESSFLMYRKDLLQQAGLTMPEHPTWDQVAQYAQKLNDPSQGTAGICLRGLPGWGEQLAPLDTVVNTFGGRWFDPKWQPQLTSPQFQQAVQFYVDLVRGAGEPGAANNGFTECLNTYNSGHAAMWYDATSGANSLTGSVAQNTGYAWAPVKMTQHSGWLWSWALGISSASPRKDAAWTFTDWATSKGYIKSVGEKLGWSHVPPGTRTSTYSLPGYQQVAGGYAQLTLQSIAAADVNHPTVQPVPYTGVQYVSIPEFQELGTQVSQQIAAAIAGNQSVNDALQKSQPLAATAGKHQTGG